MRKESVQKFDLEAAFKALNEVEIPVVKGIRPNREDLQEKFTRKLVTDLLVEDYYDVGDTEELGQAQEEREAEIAKAKLARIEKIVDLEAESEDDLLPSYVGKFIMQCPQCMTLFYKNEEDIERSEENPEVVNINEPCQHCGNSSGYTLIGKVDTVGEEEAAQYDVEDFDENELNLDFDEEEATNEESAEAEEVATEEETSEDADLDLDLAPVEDKEEEVQESLSLRESMTESDFDKVIAQISADIISEVKPTPIVEVGPYYEEFKDVYVSWEQWDEDNYFSYDKGYNDEFYTAYETVKAWIKQNAKRYPGVELKFLEPVRHENDYFITINVWADDVQESSIETWDADVANADKLLDEIIKDSGNDNYDDGDGYWSGESEWCNRYMYYANSVANRAQVEELCDKYSTDNCIFYVLEDDAEEDPVSEIGYTLTKDVKESLTEDIDKELDDKLKAHNDYIEYLKKAINDEEESLKKATNEYVKKAIQRRLDAFKADLEEALPDALKDEAISADELPTPEEVDMEAAAENKEEPKEKKESLTEGLNLDPAIAARFTKPQLDSLTSEEIKILQGHDRKAIQTVIDKYNPKDPDDLDEDLDAEHKLDAEEAALERTDAEDYIVEATNNSVMKALDALEAELTKDASLTEAKYDVSDAEFKAMLNNPVFNEGCKEELEEDLPPVSATPFEKAAAAIENAGSELTPEEQKLEDEELATKEGVEEGLTEDTALAEPVIETTDLLADDGTMAMLIYPDRFTAEERKEKLLSDPDFVKTLKAFSTKHKMLANPEDLEDGVTAEEDMYNCAFEGIEGEDLEDTLDELISYYLDIKADWDGEWEGDEEDAEELTEAPVAAPPAPSRLKRNYSITELIVKELKADPLFAGLSIRTIQRILLPYYISNMGRGRGKLSTQSMIDFFTEEGFAPYVLDHFFQMDPLARKELLKADEKFMEIFNAFAKKFKMFPTAADEKAPGESDFDFAFSVAFDMDENGVAQDNEIARETIEAFGRWYVNGAFDEKLVADIWEAVEDFDEKEFNKLTENYLTSVYSNVKSFEATGCSLDDNKLVVEGVIKFASGKTKNTTFTYETKRVIGKTLVLEGLNADFTSEKAFTLNCKVDTENRLIVESLNYNYTINDTPVEGLLK